MYRTMMMLGLLMLSICPNSIAGQYPLTVTDVAGREVVFEKQPQAIALSSGRVLPLLEILYQEKFIDHLVTWRDDMKNSAPTMYQSYLKQFPALAEVPTIGLIKSGEFDAEYFIQLPKKPDLFLVDLSNIALAEDKGLIAKLEKVGIQVLAIDFREDPANNTLTSVLSVAKALNRNKAGEAFAKYYRSQLRLITQRLETVTQSTAKKVFIERAAGYNETCCYTFAGNNMGGFLPLLKAVNIATPLLRGADNGQIAKESIIVAQPDIYIMQSTSWIDDKGYVSNGIPLGFGDINAKALAKATGRLTDRRWLKALPAHQNRQIFTVYMPFYNSPFNLVAMSHFAKWLYPQVFADVDPDAEFNQAHKNLTGREISGMFGQNNFEVM